MSTSAVPHRRERLARRSVRQAADAGFLTSYRERSDPATTDTEHPSMTAPERCAVAVIWAFLAAFVIAELAHALG